MPKIELSSAKGLVQKAGHGFVDAGYQTDSGAVDLSASSATAAAKGALVHLVTAGAGVTFTLHGEAEGATEGQIKIITLLDTNNLALSNVTPATTLTTAGDLAICVFNGSTWVVGNSV